MLPFLHVRTSPGDAFSRTAILLPGRQANAASTKRRRRTGSGHCRGNPRAAAGPQLTADAGSTSISPSRWLIVPKPKPISRARPVPARPVPVVDASISVPIADA
jgi:hypothetical protein